jgi:hypothetical protein
MPQKKTRKRVKKKPHYQRPTQAPIRAPLGYATKILDTTTVRKRGLRNLYQLVVDTQEAIVGIDDELRKSIIGQMLTIAKKLAKVADAVDDYEETERKEIERIIKQSKKSGEITAEESTRLDQKAEEVLSQAKSTLDVLVKVLKPLWNIDLHTYSKSGDGIVRSLQNNVPDEFKPKIQPLIELVENDKNWIDAFKKYRDDQHYGNLGISTIKADKDGNYELPMMPDGGLVQEYMSVLYENLFSFVMDFMACALHSRMPGEALTFAVTGEGRDRVYKLAVDTSKLPPLKTDSV